MKFKIIQKNNKRTINVDILVNAQIDDEYYLIIKKLYKFFTIKISILKELFHSLIIVFD